MENNATNNWSLVSFFPKPASNTRPYKDITLYDVYNYIVGTYAKAATEKLRTLTTKEERRAFKEINFDYITPSGTFSYHRDASLIKHSNYMVIDLDHLDNLEATHQQLLNDEYFETQLLFTSPSGDGLKWFIEIDLSAAPHNEYFDAVVKYLKQTYNIVVDKSGRNVSRGCFLPHDPNCYINEKYLNNEVVSVSAKVFNPHDWLDPKVSENSNLPMVSQDSLSMEDAIEQLVSKVETTSVDITDGYNNWRDIGFALSDAFGEDGRSYFLRLSRLHPSFNEKEANEQYTKCLNSHGSGITINTLFYLAKEHGIYTKYAISLQGDLGDMAETLPTFSMEVGNLLPDLLHDVVHYASDPDDADLLILTSIVTLSACLPNVYGIYDGRSMGANLFLFISSPASAGKGRLSLCRNLVQPIHDDLKRQFNDEMEEYKMKLNEYTLDKRNNDEPEEPACKMLIIPGNSSSTAVYQTLNENDCIGLFFETEGDTLANTFKSDYGNFSDGLRKAFHHEPITYCRRKDREVVEVPHPNLSVVLSGTPRQILNLIGDSENGLFSRFIFYKLNFRLAWRDVFAQSDAPLDDSFAHLGQIFFEFYKKLKNSAAIRFSLTKNQQSDFNTFFDQIQNEYYHIFGEDIVASIRRLGLITFRIAMILTTLRYIDKDIPPTIVCSDTDFNTSLVMAKVLLKHTEKVFGELPTIEKDAPGNGLTVLNQTFYDNLPLQFDRKIYLSVASILHIKARSADKQIKRLCDKGKLNHLAHGFYGKP